MKNSNTKTNNFISLDKAKTLLYSILNSYSQVFFSENKLFAGLLVMVSFLNYQAGIAGLIAVLVSNGAAWLLGFNKYSIKKGLYGFNSLLTGLGLGIYFEPNLQLMLVIVFTSLFVFFLTIVLQGVIGKYNLPFLSIPFLIGIWTVTIATREFQALGLSSKGIYVANELHQYGGNALVNIYYWFIGIEVPGSLHSYFRSLGAIFFQDHLFAGIVICIGMLIYSRIALSLSLIGFFAAYFFYMIIGVDISTLNYSYIGFNFILTSIALGGFFLVPSRISYLCVLLLLPIVAIITISTHTIFSSYQLSIYSLPFNIVVLLFLYSLKLRTTFSTKLSEVVIQHNSPEKNLYYFKNSSERFKDLKYMPISLPFWGEWTVSQGHNGKYTHKGDWKHAWDFVITNANKEQYENRGDYLTDYFCYNKAIVAPADGTVQEIVDGIEDNIPGDVNTTQNWGNTIIIKHSDYLYTKMSHLRSGSIKPAKGDFVKKSEAIASCGNSGRSPYPHLHFQVQTTPYIGSGTIDYPINHYLSVNNKNYKFNSFEKPVKDDIISNINTNNLLKQSMHLIPGKKLKFTVSKRGGQDTKEILWEVKTDIYNNSYIHCKASNSFAYFQSNESLHYFRDFIGNKESLLYYFFQAFFMVPMGFYQNLQVKDNMPVNLTFGKLPMFFQDFIAPFTLFLKSKYELYYTEIDNELSPGKIELKSEVNNFYFGKRRSGIQFETIINNKGNIYFTAKKRGDILFVAEQITDIEVPKT
jgi:urea transporter